MESAALTSDGSPLSDSALGHEDLAHSQQGGIVMDQVHYLGRQRRPPHWAANYEM